MKTKVFTKGFVFLSLGAFFALCVLLALGTWQVKRLHWKEALIERVEARMAGKPQPIDFYSDASSLSQGSDRDVEYSRVILSGRFDHDIEFFYYATLDGKPGFHIYSPFYLENSPKIVFVNRGFVPDDKKDPTSRPNSKSDGLISFTGLLRWPDLKKPNSFIPDNDAKANIFFWRDQALMVRLATINEENVLPFFVYADRHPSDALPIGGVTIVDFPNSHLAYAVTWYGLALTLIGVFGAMLWTRFHQARTDV